jgi:hypothetical protein
MAAPVTITACAYCGQPKDFADGFHSCPQAQEAKQRLQTAVSGIKADILKPEQRRFTPGEAEARQNRLRQVAQTVKISGGRVKPGYR